MTLSERILVDNRGTLERVRHMQMFRAMTIFFTRVNMRPGNAENVGRAMSLLREKLQPSLLKTTRQVRRQLHQAAAGTQH